VTTSTHPRYPNPPLVVEVSGDFACFTRPELKSERFSYEVMTPSAARGILEAIFWKPEFSYLICKIEVLNPIRWFSIRRNEVKSTISEDWVRRAMADTSVRYDVEEDRDQRNTIGLRDVAYRIYAQVELRPHATGNEVKYREQFRRRVDKGACYSQPFLGCREFSARFGKSTGRKPVNETRDLGLMLHSIHYSGGKESYEWFFAELKNGVMEVPRQGIQLASTAVRS
jgi:CRISPR-associated protein Cas5d